jgi:hypothetical protein
MSGGFYVLQRLYVRVDRVLYRLFDTRVYHPFQEKHIIREYTERELDAENLNKILERHKLCSTHVFQAEELGLMVPVSRICTELCFYEEER